jgi:hypothetical protein
MCSFSQENKSRLLAFITWSPRNMFCAVGLLVSSSSTMDLIQTCDCQLSPGQCFSCLPLCVRKSGNYCGGDWELAPELGTVEHMSSATEWRCPDLLEMISRGWHCRQQHQSSCWGLRLQMGTVQM